MKPTAWLRKAASSFSGSRYGSTPSSVTAPEVGGSSPPAIYSSVLLPAPEGPMMAADSPRRRVSEMPASTVRGPRGDGYCRSEEHTSELQSLRHLVCRLLLEKKKMHYTHSLRCF